MMSDAEESVLLIVAESMVAAAEATIAAANAQREASRALTLAIDRQTEALRSMPVPVVNVAAAEAPEVRIEAPIVNVPDVQRVQIVGLPPMNAKVRRDRSGRIEGIEE